MGRAINGTLMQIPVLTLVVFSPLLGVLALLLIPGHNHRAIRWVALGAALVSFGFSCVLLGYQVGGPEFQFREDYSWIPAFGMRYTMGVDGLSVVLVVLTTVLSVVAILYSWTPIQTRVKEYYATMLLLMVGMLGVFVALDLFLFYVFWEISLIPMYLVIGIWGGARRIYATVKFVIYTLVGSLLMLVAILAVAIAHGSATGNFTFSYEALRGFSFAINLQALAFIAFFLAFAIKVPMWPLHTWLPDAHVEAPTAGSVMLAGVLLKMGTYGMIRFCLPLFPEASRRAAGWVAVLAIIGIIYGALVAMVQPNLKKLVAYSSVSHLGFVVLGIFTFHNISMQGAVYQMLAHGISTGALFLLVGMLYDRRHTFEISEYGGLATPMPKLAAFFLFVALSSLGLPMLNGFVGEYLVLLGTYQRHWGWASWAALGVIFSACYLLWSYQRVFFGEITREKNRALPDASAREKWILATMAVVTLWMGIGSTFITKRTAAAAQDVIDQVEPQRPYEAAAPSEFKRNVVKLNATPTQTEQDPARAAANIVARERLGIR